MSVRRLVVCSAALGATLAAPAAAQAAAPIVTTRAAESVGQNTARLRGTVNPRGKATVFYFQYGTTKAYGSQTPEAPVRNGRVARSVGLDIAGLKPFTTYHFRVVARNGDGTRVGADRAFRTARQPLGFLFAATPNPAGYGAPVTLAGGLGGTGNANRPVALEQRPFPYTAPWARVGDRHLVGADGAFSFPLLGVLGNTQYRVVTTDASAVSSGIVQLFVKVRVHTSVSSTRVSRGGRVRFSGTITPAKPGALFGIQKRNSKGAWVTVAGDSSRSLDDRRSRFSKRVRVRRSGSYRVFVAVTDGVNVSNVGRTVRVRVRR